MSCSSLYGIKPDYTGEIVNEYKNSWWFSPIVWSVLSDKTLPRDFMGYVQSIIGLHGQDVWKKINTKMNNSENTPDRICWEMSNQQIFFTKDKGCIADSIRKFVEKNKNYDKDDKDNLSPLEREHIIERFNEIADDIVGLDEKEYPYFVLKNTSVDDDVSFWFSSYDEESDEYTDKSIKDWDKLLAEFVVIENDQIVKFISNFDYQYE